MKVRLLGLVACTTVLAASACGGGSNGSGPSLTPALQTPAPTSTPVVHGTSSPTPAPSSSSVASATPSVAPTATSGATATPSAAATAAATSAPTATPVATPVPVVTPSASPSATATPVVTPTPQVTLAPFATQTSAVLSLAAGFVSPALGYSVPQRGIFFVQPGTLAPSSTATIQMSFADAVPSGLPAFDPTKVVIAAVSLTSSANETVNGSIVINFSSPLNGNYQHYFIALLDPTGTTWWMNLASGTLSTNGVTISTAAAAYPLNAGQPVYAVLYADPILG